MSKRDVEKYYETICNQYHDLLNELRDFEEEATKGLIEPERLDTIKESLKPLVANYERVSYIMFLLNQPNKKEKKKKYIKQISKKLSQLDKNNSIESTIEENKEVLDSFNKKS